MPTITTNEDRAQSAHGLLLHFHQLTRFNPADEVDLEELMRDLFCNLRHLCAQERIDIDRAWALAQDTFEEELSDDE